MKTYKGDLHIHTVLSPCASLSNSPKNIVEKAKACGLNFIGITDHNNTRHAALIKKIAEKQGLTVLMGAEITTKEEVHCLAFLEKEEQLNVFQAFVDKNITFIKNDEDKYGYQPVVNEQEEIVEMIPHYLPAALKVGISEIQQEVYRLNGIFVPAHIDRMYNGIISQLGFIPPKLQYDALGITPNIREAEARKKFHIVDNVTLIRNSDAHFIEDIGRVYSLYKMNDVNFKEIQQALRKENGRVVKIKE